MEGDIAMMRAIPGVRVFCPADYTQAIHIVEKIAEGSGVDYLRVTRSDFPIFLDEAPIELGKAQKLLEGNDMTFVATGSMVYEALKVAEKFTQSGKTVEFLNIHTIKPLDAEAICASASKTKKVVVFEEHNIH